MAPFRMYLFGVPRVEHNGKEINIPRRKSLALLAYLAVTATSHSREALATLLWPENDRSSALANLRRELSRFKRTAGEHILKIERHRVEINPLGELWVDVQAFEQGVAKAKQHGHQPTELCADCLASLTKAVGYYTGDFLAGFSIPDSVEFDDWQFFQSESLRRKLAEALQQLIEWHVYQGEFQQSTDYGRRWLALDPLHEPAHRQLMRLYAWSGQGSLAIRQYQECQRLLDEELGLEPEKETTTLYEAIRTKQLPPPQKPAAEHISPLEIMTSTPSERYVPEELLAVGGQGEVYLGRDLQSDQPVVIKRLKPDLLARKPEIMDRFIREGQALHRLNHPNIVAILNVLEKEGQPSIVMEYVPGGSLSELLAETPQLPLGRALDIALELADALSRAHHLGILHRDLKPANVLLAEDGTPRLTDFGMALLGQDEARLTKTDELIGSPAYMSPEALRGEELDARSDIWAFGVLLYETLSGRLPFEGDHITAVIASVLHDSPTEIGSIRADLPPAVVDLLNWMLVKEREKRITSMRQVAATLEAIRARRTIDTFPEREFAPPASAKPSTSREIFSQPMTAGQTIAALSAIEAPFLKDITPTRSEEPVFVSRQRELKQLYQSLKAALEGQHRVVFVIGEAGRGKTALLNAFARRAQRLCPTLVVANGNCNAFTDLGDPYLPFREILQLLTGDISTRAQAGTLRLEQARRLWNIYPHTVQALAQTAPDLLDTFIPAQNLFARMAAYAPEEQEAWEHLQSLLSSQVRKSGEKNLQQSALFEAYMRLLQSLASVTPLLLILDDLQWADLGSTNLLFSLGKRLQGQRIMILGAYRPAEVAMGLEGKPHPLVRVVHELQRDMGDIVIDLTQAEGREFINALLDSEPNRLGASFRETLYLQTGGHPLFTVELLGGMQERGDLVKDEDNYWTEQASLDWNALPARVEGAIGERIGRLGQPLQELLQIASFEGEEFTAEVVAQVLNRDEREVVRQLSGELDKKHRLVRATEIKRVGKRRLSHYRFRHILIQRYLYYTLDEVERVYYHEAIGNALEAIYGEQAPAIAPQLARHFLSAETPEKAIVHLQRAAEQALRSAALAEAARYYQLALENWPEDDQPGQAKMLRLLGECQWVLGDPQEALKTFEKCYALSEAIGNKEYAGGSQRLIGRMYWEMGDRAKSLHYYQRALSILVSEPESTELAWAISSISQMHMLAAEYDQAIAWGERALVMAERLGAEPVIFHALNNVGTSYLDTGQIDRGRAMLKESAQRSLDFGYPHDACRALGNLGEGLAGWGFYVEARQAFEESFTYAERYQVGLFAGSSLVELATIEWLQGHWQVALARRYQIQEWIERNPALAYLELVAQLFFAWMYNDLGQAQAAYQLLEKALPKVESNNEMQMTAPYLEQMARAQAMLGWESQVESTVQAILDKIEQESSADRYWIMPLLFACYWFTRRSPSPGALAQAQTSLQYLESVNQRFTTLVTQAALNEGQGIVALASSDSQQAIEQLHQAATLWQTIGRPYDQARALNSLACATRQSGELDEAQAACKQAFDIIQSLANQLEEDEAKNAFLNSPLVKEVHRTQDRLKDLA